MTALTANIEKNVEQVLDRMTSSCTEVGRAVSEVTLVVASKGRSVSQIAAVARALANAPCAWVLGESYLQELEEKFDSMKSLAPVHFIGRLQSNKIPHLGTMVQMVHSVASVRHVAAMQKYAPQLPYLLQVNVSHDPAKAGFIPEEITKEIVAGSAGLMTILENDLSSARVSECYRILRQARDQLQPENTQLALSMGMSSDYPLALQQGATHIRVGSAIFG